MPYNITKSDGTIIFQLADGLVDTSHASIKFIGKNVSNYGEIQNDNLLWMLEHFARDTPPSNYLDGQLWFDSTIGFSRFACKSIPALNAVWYFGKGCLDRFLILIVVFIMDRTYVNEFFVDINAAN